MKIKTSLAIMGVFALTFIARAEVKPNALFTDGAVLQRGVPVPVWGTSSPGEEVTILFASQTKRAQADAVGKWLVKLDPMPASAVPQTLKITGDVNPACYGVWIANSDRVVIRHNRIVNPGALPVTWVSYAAYKNIPIPDLQAAICLGAVSHAEVTDNEIVFGNPRCRRAVLVLPTCDSASIRVERIHERVLDH